MAETPKPKKRQSKDSLKDSNQDSKDSLEITMKNGQDIKTDMQTDTPKTLESVESVHTEDTKPSLVSVSEPEPSTVEEQLSQAAKLEMARRKQDKIAAEMLASGFSVRETAAELQLPKSRVEKISKQTERETRTNERQEYLNKPYEEMNRKMSEIEEEKEDSLLASGWVEKTYRKLLRMKIESDMMRKMGLLGNDGENNGGSRINVQELLLVKLAASGGQSSAEELSKFASAMKSLFAPQQTDALDTFAKLQEIETKGVEKFKQAQAEIESKVSQKNTTNLVEKLVSEGARVASSFLSKPPSVPNLPPPTSLLTSQVVEPNTIVEAVPSALETASEIQQTVDNSALGYTNLNKPSKVVKTD